MEIIGVIAELFIAILAGIVQLIGLLIQTIVSQTWLAAHRKGTRRFGHLLAVAMGLFLAFGLARFFVEGLATPGLTPIYQWPMVLGALFLLLVGMAIGDVARAPKPQDATAAEVVADQKLNRNADNAGFLAIIVFFVVLLGATSAIFSERHEATLADRLCDQADARISDDLETAVRDGADLFDRVFGTETADHIPCEDK